MNDEGVPSILSRVLDICADVLGEQMAAGDDFLNRGVSSIAIASVRGRLMSEFSVDIPVRLMFDSPNMSCLCQEILRLQDSAEAESSTISPGDRSASQG